MNEWLYQNLMTSKTNMIINKDLAKEIATPLGYAYLEYLERKFPGDEDMQLAKWGDRELFKRFEEWMKTNKR
jgi:hypothetical protein